MKDEYDVMLSYQWDSKDQVIEFEKALKIKGLAVWRDDSLLCSNDKPLTEQLGMFLFI